jgi:hypothetical protein
MPSPEDYLHDIHGQNEQIIELLTGIRDSLDRIEDR